MKILVTGANGFLGNTVVELFKNAGHDIYATARTTENNRIECDLSNTSHLLQLIEKTTPEVIVNCAAVVNFDTDYLAEQYPVNSLVSAIMAAWCNNNNAYMCQVSGSIVHGTTIEMVNSDTLISAENEYGLIKWLAEQMIEASGATAVRVRFSGIFGTEGPEHLGLNRAIRAARKGTVPSIVGRGIARRNYIHVIDAANVLLYCVENEISGVRWGGGRETHSIAELMQMICDVYLPDHSPEFIQGPEASDQIIEVSPDLPKGIGFREALSVYN